MSDVKPTRHSSQWLVSFSQGWTLFTKQPGNDMGLGWSSIKVNFIWNTKAHGLRRVYCKWGQILRAGPNLMTWGPHAIFCETAPAGQCMRWGQAWGGGNPNLYVSSVIHNFSTGTLVSRITILILATVQWSLNGIRSSGIPFPNVDNFLKGPLSPFRGERIVF